MTIDATAMASNSVERLEKRKLHLYFLLKQHYSNLSLLYAFASGTRKLKVNENTNTSSNVPSKFDENIFAWTVGNLKTQIIDIEQELSFLNKILKPSNR